MLRLNARTDLGSVCWRAAIAVWVCVAGFMPGRGLDSPAVPSGASLPPFQSKAAPIRFIDIAANSDFRYRTNNNYTGRKYFPQPMCGGVAILDYDHDDKPDIFFTNGAKLPELKK